MKLRIGLIGAGANTRLRHIPGLRAVADVEGMLDLLRQQSAALTQWADARICTSCWHAIPPIAVIHPGRDHRGICATCWERQHHGDPDYVPGEN